MDKINPSMPGQPKNMSTVWIVVVIVIVAAALGGMMYYFQTLSQEKFVAQEEAINDLREELGEPPAPAEVEEEAAYRVFRSEDGNEKYDENFTFEYADGWHVLHENEGGLIEKGKITVNPNPIVISETDNFNVFDTWVLITIKKQGLTLDGLVMADAGSPHEDVSDTIIAGYPGKIIHPNRINSFGGGENFEIYVFVTPDAEYTVMYFYPNIADENVDLPAEYQHIIDSFKIESGS